MSLLKRLITLVFPASCLVCRHDLTPEDHPGICGRCRASITRIQPLFCRRCGLPLPEGGAHCYSCRRKRGGALKKIRSAALYKGSLKDAIKQFKYHKKTYLAPTFGELLHQTLLENLDLLSCSHLVPIPMHSRKQRKQGYNHAELLARELCKRTGQKLQNRWLIRVKGGPSQTELSREERRENVTGAFQAIPPTEGRMSDILLIDDVCTTGATLEECAKVLKEAGCRSIYALTVAREAPVQRTHRT